MKMNDVGKVNVLVLDLDGTLFANGTCEYKSPENKEALMRWRDAGKQLWIATGRGADTIHNLEKMEIHTDAMICSGGAGFMIRSHEAEYNYRISDECAKRLFRYLEDKCADLDYFLDVNPSDVHYGKSSGNHMKRHMKREFEMHEPTEYMDGKHELLRLFCVGPDDIYVDHVAEMINYDFKGELHALHTDHHCIDILNVSCSKGNQMKNLMRIMNRNKEEIAAVGDEATDISLLAEAGLGFAMADGSEELIRKTERTVISVAEAVSFLLKE